MFHFDKHPEYSIPGVLPDQKPDAPEKLDAVSSEEPVEDYKLCVVQTTTGDEKTILLVMDAIVDQKLILERFMPQREVMRKRYGKWRKVKERLFPGYVFISTRDPIQLFFQLKNVPYLTRLLGDADAEFIVLNEKEQRYLERIGGTRKDHVFRISKVQVESDLPYKKGDKVRIISGDLAAFEGDVVGFDLHHRKAMIKTDLFGGLVMHVGIELAQKIEV